MRLGIVGLGAAGLAAALAAAEAGHEVVGFEQSGLDNQEASSGGRGKIIRFGYEEPFYADLMRSTMQRWTDLAERTGARLMDVHGGLHIGPAGTVAVIEHGIQDAGQPSERLDARSERLGLFGIRLDDRDLAVYEPAAGVMWPSAVRQALATEAARAGASLRDQVRVEDLTETSKGVTIGDETFDGVIVSGGPWAFRLAPRARDAFTISRRFQLVFGTDRPIGDGLPRPWIDMSGSTVYGMINVSPGVHLIGLHELDQGQVVNDPDEPDDTGIRTTSIAQQAAYVRSRFGVEPREIDIRVCHYTMTASEDFVIDACPPFERVTLLSPCSGHGFKFAITMGAYAASVAAGQPIPDRERFRLQFATMS